MQPPWPCAFPAPSQYCSRAALEGTMPRHSAYAVEMRGIVKRFPGVLANDHVDFDLRAGEIHALLGENGAGKSTLMNVLAGLYRARGRHASASTASRSTFAPRATPSRAGIGMVHQHFMLVPSQTVTENILLGLDEPRFCHAPAPLRAASGRAGRAIWPAGRSPGQDLAALGGRAAARRNPQDALPGRRHPDHGRADRRPGPPGDRRSVPHPALHGRRGQVDRLYQPQAGRGDGHCRPDHRAAQGPGDRRRADVRADTTPRRPGPADGRPRGALSRRQEAAVPAGRGRRWTVEDVSRRQRQGPAGPARRLASRSARARSWAWPGWPATGSASWPR